MDFFVWQPGRAAVVAAAFLAAFAAAAVLQRTHGRVRSAPLLVPTVLWGVYALWEWEAWRERANIRVDLLLIYPVLLAVSVAALFLTFRWKRPRTRPVGRPSTGE